MRYWIYPQCAANKINSASCINSEGHEVTSKIFNAEYPEVTRAHGHTLTRTHAQSHNNVHTQGTPASNNVASKCAAPTPDGSWDRTKPSPLPLVSLYATRRIEAGEELFQAYGDSFWEAAGVRVARVIDDEDLEELDIVN